MAHNEIIVINKHHLKDGEQPTRTFYVGRPSALGNPFVITPRWDRDYVVNLYRLWLKKKLQENDARVIEALNTIAAHVMDGSGQAVRLMCFCAPQRCHADEIKATIEAAIKESQNA